MFGEGFEYDPGQFTLSDGYGDMGYDTSGLGEWAYQDPSAMLPVSTWGQEQSPLSVTDVQSYYPEVEAPSGPAYPSVTGGQGYDNKGMGAWGAKTPGSVVAGAEAAKEKPGLLSGVGKALGLTNKEGEMDFTDPKTIDKLIKLGLGIAGASSAMNQNRQQPQQQALQQQLVQQRQNTWTPQQAVWASRFFDTPTNPNRGTVQAGAGGIKSIVPSPGYASGGGIGAVGDDRYRGLPEVPRVRDDRNIFDATRSRRFRDAGLEEAPVTLQEGRRPTFTSEMVPMTDLLRSIPALIKAYTSREDYAEGGALEDPMIGSGSDGALGLLEGPGTGQSDSIPINAARGEYVMDAETVSMLGDGSNEAGAEILDSWRQRLRAIKRGAPHDDIPPPAGDPMQYLPKGVV